METASPNYFRYRCVCHWGPECLNLKKLLDEAGDVLLTRMILFRPGSSQTSTALRSAMKTFHARAGASFDSWKRKNTAREVKGSSDASLRADLKSRVSQATKKAGEFQIRKREASKVTTPNIVSVKTAKTIPKSKPKEDGTEVVEEGPRVDC